MGLSGLLSTGTLSAAFAAGGNPFPIDIRHALGTTRIEAEPKRIVTLGWNGEDAVLALGRIPVGMHRYGLFERGILPWNEAYLKGQTPELLQSGVLDYEAIAALEPDLILAIKTGINEIEWQRLSSIAPTIVYTSAPWRADWREQMVLTGLALGEPQKAHDLVETAEKQLRDLATAHPELMGKTFIFGSYFPGEGTLGVYFARDPRVRELVAMGLRLAPEVDALMAKAPDANGTGVSLEELDRFDADVLIVWYGPGARADAEGQPLFKSFGPVRRGAYVALDDPVSVWATSAVSVLSIPYAFPDFVERIAAAAAKGR
jgi:iron complex transport system substrate-binding protein